MIREVFATLRKAIDEREEQTIGDIKEAAYEREKALEVSHVCLSSYNSCVVVMVTSCKLMYYMEGNLVGETLMSLV